MNVLSDTGLRVLFDAWVQAVWEADAQGGTLDDWPSWRAYTGQTVEEWQRYGWAAAVHPDDRAVAQRQWQAALANGAPLDAEYRLRKHDGTWNWSNARATPVLAQDGSIRGWVGMNIDLGLRRSTESALSDSAELNRLILENATDYAIVTVNERAVISSWSIGAEVTYGWSAAQAIGRPFSVIFPTVARLGGVPENLLREAQKRGITAQSGWRLRRDGTQVFIESTLRALTDGRREHRGVLVIGKNVTERRRIEEALAESQARFLTLLDNVRDHAIFLLDPDGTITEWPRSAESVTGRRASEIVGRHLSVLYPGEAVAAGEVDAELLEAATSGRAEREGWRVGADGRTIWSEEVLTAVCNGAGELTGFTKVARDVTVRQSAQAAFERERALSERDELRNRLALAEEDERRYLARELHDTAGQHLTALSLGLRSLGDLVQQQPDAAKQTHALQNLTEALCSELHALAVRLRPRALDDFGFEDAVAAYAEEWSRRSHIAADLHVVRQHSRLAPAIEDALYRIVREALTNVARHSGAARVAIVVERRDGQVHVIVEDDGCGFDPGDVATHAEHLGLLGMRERAQALGGDIEMEAAAGHGTTLFVRIPF